MHARVAGVVETGPVLERDHEPARLAAIDHLTALLDAARVQRMHHGEADSRHLLRAALVHGRGRGHALPLQVGVDLVVAHHGRLVLLAQRHRIAHVIAVTVRDRHDVQPVERLVIARACRVALDPWIDEHGLHAARDELERAVTEPGECETALDLRGHVPSLP